MREVCFLIAAESVLRAYSGNAAAIPDSRERWAAIWENRDRIDEIVHTHPGDLLAFSREDLTTMQAVDAATGRAFRWSIVTRSGYLIRDGHAGKERLDEPEPWWTDMLRELSFGKDRNS